MGIVKIVLIVVQRRVGRGTTTPEVNQAADYRFHGTKVGVSAASLANALAPYTILLSGESE